MEQHHRPQHEQDHFGETPDGHRRGADVHKSFPKPEDPRRHDKAAPRMAVPFRNASSPLNCERNSPRTDTDEPDDGDISPRFESPNSVHSGTGPDHDEPPSLDNVRHEIAPGSIPGRAKRTLAGSPGCSPPRTSEEPGVQASMARHERANMPAQFDPLMRSHQAFEAPHEHVGKPRMEGQARSLPGRFEGNAGPGTFESPGGHGPPRFDGPNRFDGHAQQRFERPPLLPMPNGPLRCGGGRFDGQASGHFDSPVGHQGPRRFDGPGPMRYNSPMPQNRFDGPARFDHPHLAPVLNNPAGFEGPMRFPNAMNNYDGPMRLDGSGGQGMMRFDNPAQPGPMRFDAQPPGMAQGTPRYCGPQNMLNSFGPQGQILVDQGALMNPVVPPGGFNMNPTNTFDNQSQQFHMQQNLQQANFNLSDPAGFPNAYRPVQFPGGPTQNPTPPVRNPLLIAAVLFFVLFSTIRILWCNICNIPPPRVFRLVP